MSLAGLKKEELDVLKEWLILKKVNMHHIHRSLSDGVAVAQLLKTVFPKLVDLHNYRPCSSIPLKIENWDTLNFKILDKVKMHQNKEQINKIVRAVPGAIEKLLYKIMKAEKGSMKDPAQIQEENWARNEEITTVALQKKVGDTIVVEKEKMILFSIYEDVLKEIARKDLLIKAEERKMIHYQNLLQLREERIRELKSQLMKQASGDESASGSAAGSARGSGSTSESDPAAIDDETVSK